MLKLSDELMQEIYERTMTASEKRKDTMLKKKYDDSDMKKNMQAQYGKEEGKKVYFATIRKQAMKKEEVESVEEKIKYDKSGSSMDYFLGADPKKTEYYKKNAKKKIKKEEVEVVNEVSKKTLGSYVKKAATEIGTSAMKGDYKKMQKRHKGVLDASDKMAKEEVIPEAKVDKGRSDYGKASIRNYRRMGPGHGDPGMFDPSGKRGKTIEKRREEHKARRGVKGAKVPAYKVDEGSSYGLYRGSGKASGAMKDYLDRKAKMLKKKRDKQSDAAKNNPHFDSTQPSPSGRNKYEQVTFQQFQEKCWPGYEKKGMKTMFGKRYPNCVKKKK